MHNLPSQKNQTAAMIKLALAIEWMIVVYLFLAGCSNHDVNRLKISSEKVPLVSYYMDTWVSSGRFCKWRGKHHWVDSEKNSLGCWECSNGNMNIDEGMKLEIQGMKCVFCGACRKWDVKLGKWEEENFACHKGMTFGLNITKMYLSDGTTLDEWTYKNGRFCNWWGQHYWVNAKEIDPDMVCTKGGINYRGNPYSGKPDVLRCAICGLCADDEAVK